MAHALCRVRVPICPCQSTLKVGLPLDICVVPFTSDSEVCHGKPRTRDRRACKQACNIIGTCALTAHFLLRYPTNHQIATVRDLHFQGRGGCAILCPVFVVQRSLVASGNTVFMSHSTIQEPNSPYPSRACAASPITEYATQPSSPNLVRAVGATKFTNEGWRKKSM